MPVFGLSGPPVKVMPYSRYLAHQIDVHGKPIGIVMLPEYLPHCQDDTPNDIVLVPLPSRLTHPRWNQQRLKWEESSFLTKLFPWILAFFISFTLFIVAANAQYGNARALQGFYVNATPPTDGQVLKWVGADNWWIPSVDNLVGSARIIGALSSNFPITATTGSPSYRAFPGMIKLADETTLLVVYYLSESHGSHKGIIVKRTSTNAGRTWSEESTVYSAAVNDVRDSNLLKLNDGNPLLTYFEYTVATGPALGCFTKLGNADATSWGTGVRVDNFTDWGACSDHAIELPNGDLLQGAYGEDVAEAFTSSRVYKSVDGGSTWAFLATIANGVTASRNYTEPNLIQMASGDILAAIRNNIDEQVATSESADDGATWSAVTNRFAGISKATMGLLEDDTILAIYRSVSTVTGLYEPAYRVIAADNSSWGTETIYDLDETNFGVSFNYAAIMSDENGLVAVSYCLQSSGAVSNCYFQYFAGGGTLNRMPTLIGRGLYSTGRAYSAVAFISPMFKTTTADVADAGVIRLGNAEGICWEASPTGTDGCITYNSSEQIAFDRAALFSTMTLGSCFFAGTGGLLDQDNANCFFDNTNNTFGIGTTRTGAISATNSRLRIVGSGATSATAAFDIQTSGGAPNFIVRDDGSTGIGVVAPGSKLSVALGSAFIPPLGVNGGALSLLNSTALFGVLAGVRIDGVGYIQVQRVDATATAFNLVLQPNGSNVGIAAITPASLLSVGGATVGNFQVNSTGLVAAYKAIATAGNGVPAIYAYPADLTAQTTAISATTLYAVPASGAGLYRVCYEGKVTTVASTGAATSVLGGAAGFQVVYTHKTDSVVTTTAASATSNLNTTQAQVHGCVMVNAKASTNIQYSFGYTSDTAAQMQFTLARSVEKL